MNEILIDGQIGTGQGMVSSSMVRAMLPEDQTQPIHVKIHSEGGSVLEGFRIFDLFDSYQGQKKITIESSAFSIASFIPMAFDEVEITPNGYLMLHNPYMIVEGDDEDLVKEAEFLAKMKQNMVAAYSRRSGKTEDEIRAILKAETYLNAEESVANGFCNRITSKPVIGRVFAQAYKMPHGVVAALFGAGSGGNEPPEKENSKMADQKPVAATIDEIEAAFPKMKATTILACLKKQMPMASVATAAVEELMAENAELMAKIQAMEEEMATSMYTEPEETVAMEMEVEEEVVAMEDEEEAKPVAKRAGVAPVAKTRVASQPSAKAKWESELQSRIQNGLDRQKALKAVDRDFPGLRARMLQEVNGR